MFSSYHKLRYCSDTCRPPARFNLLSGDRASSGEHSQVAPLHIACCFTAPGITLIRCLPFAAQTCGPSSGATDSSCFGAWQRCCLLDSCLENIMRWQGVVMHRIYFPLSLDWMQQGAFTVPKAVIQDKTSRPFGNPCPVIRTACI